MKLINNYPGSKLLEEIMSWANKYSIKRRKNYLFTPVKNFNNVKNITNYKSLYLNNSYARMLNIERKYIENS